MPLLAARGGDADRQRSVPRDTIRLRGEAGLLSAMAPAARGGLELGLEAVTRVTRAVARGTGYDIADRAHARLVGAHCAGGSRRVVAALMEASGAGAHHLTSPLQRLRRDVEALSGHVVFDEDAAAELAGKCLLGVDLPPLALV